MCLHILVIEDAPALVALYQDVFADEGYAVTVADRVPTDLTAIEQLAPDVIVMEYLFAGEAHGWSFVQALKQRAATQDIPVLICTAADHTVQEHLGYLQTQQVGLLRKPFAVDALLNGINDVVCAARAEGQTVRGETPEVHAQAVG